MRNVGLDALQAGFRKGRGTRDQITNTRWIIEKGIPEKLCFIDYTTDSEYVDHNKLWKVLEEMGIPDHLTCLLEICMQVKKQQLELDVEQ